MTEPKNIYLEYNVDVNKLTRDYQKFPLKKVLNNNHCKEWEKIPKEDFVYLYIECNLRKNVLSQYLNVSKNYITNLCKLYNVKKSPKQWITNAKKTTIEKYGVENYSQTDEWKEKVKQTCMENYGVEYPSQSPIIQERMKQTCLKLYGVKNYSQTKECQEKIKQTNLQNLGVERPAQSPIVQEKMKQTFLQNYGVENPFQSPIVQEKMKQTCLQNYGVENYSQSDERKKLYEDKEFVNKLTQKQYETKKKNHTFNTSEEEDKIYDILLTKFKEVIRQYKSELYPFLCDFYIPEKDLYIEYQGHWSHNREPYLGTDNQNKIVESWKGRDTESYSRAIEIWTISDPIKRDTAKRNNLNWLEFFNMKEFIKWFESI